MNAIQFDGTPIPLPDIAHAVDPFEVDLLPDPFQGWITDISERIQCPMDYPAVAAMVTLAAVVGRRIGIRPQQKTDWLVVPNLWGCIIGRPGVMKTPAILEPIKPLKRLEIQAQGEHKDAMDRHAAGVMVREQQKKRAQQDIRTALDENLAEAHAIARGVIADEVDPPNRTRYLVNDCTVEQLGVILNQNRLGHVLCYRDELVGFFVGLDKDGQEQARAFYLESWNGNGRFTYDRIGRGTVDIEAAIINILGTIQPGPLQSYLAGSNKRSADDGLIQRFQLMVWPDVSANWRNVEQWPDVEAKNTAHQVYFDLAKLDPRSISAQFDDDDRDSIPFLRFNPTAQVIFDEWREPLEYRVRSGEEHPAMESHLAKYRSLVPSLALLDHLAGPRFGPVGTQSIERAIRWAKYLETHARRVYGATINDRFAPARELAKRITNGAIRTPFAARDVYRNNWSGLPDALAVDQACDILADHHWLAMDRCTTAGRTATVYHIHPTLSAPNQSDLAN